MLRKTMEENKSEDREGTVETKALKEKLILVG